MGNHVKQCPRGDKKNLKTRYYPLLALAILIPLAAVAASNSLVFGQASCAVQINGSASATVVNSNSYVYNSESVQLTVPVGAGCPNMGSQLWATGTVYDPTVNANVGSANGVLNSNGGYYTGQVVFSLPLSVLEHQLQVSITVYDSAQNGEVDGSTSQTITIHGTYNPPSSSYGYTYPSYYYYNGGYYYYYNSYPNNYNGSCYNGQMLIYYNGAYYYVSCYSYWHNH